MNLHSATETTWLADILPGLNVMQQTIGFCGEVVGNVLYNRHVSCQRLFLFQIL